MFDVIIVMAGRGSRTSLAYNKVFYPLFDIPIYEYSLNTFLSIPECHKVILVVNQDEVKEVIKHQSDKVLITIGGPTRQDSVFNGMELVESEYVLIHDGARPNVKVEDILKVYMEAKLHQASVLATPVVNTIKNCQDGFCLQTLERKNLFSMQTPQGVKKEIFKKALKQAKLDNFVGTDDVELLEKYSRIPAKIVIGKDSNLKITNDLDLKIMEMLMKEGL